MSIQGTGTNASYIENIDRVQTFVGDKTEIDYVAINMEWGAYGDDGCLDKFRTNYDRILDNESLHPKQQTFVIYSKSIISYTLTNFKI